MISDMQDPDMRYTLKVFLWTYSFVSPIVFSLMVILLGFITPGYSHMQHTISRLAIMEYGWVQELNFVQLAIGFFVIGLVCLRTMTSRQSRRIWFIISILCAASLILVSLFPTDPIENIKFSPELLSPSGLVHISIVMIFFFLSPFGVRSLKRALLSEKQFSQLSTSTAIIGYGVCFLCLVWIVFFVAGLYLPYRGIFQKGIVAVCVYWLLRVLFAIRNVFLRQDNSSIAGEEKSFCLQNYTNED